MYDDDAPPTAVEDEWYGGGGFEYGGGLYGAELLELEKPVPVGNIEKEELNPVPVPIGTESETLEKDMGAEMGTELDAGPTGNEEDPAPLDDEGTTVEE